MIFHCRLHYAFLFALCFIGRGQCNPCPETDYGFSSCGGATVTTQLDWTTYPDSSCQEWEIFIQESYTADTCTWRVELTDIPGGVMTGLTVNVLPDGQAAATDTITITFELSGVQAAAAYSGDLADLYTNTYCASISPSGEADAVEISFNSGSGAGGATGFTMRVVAYAMDVSSTCGSATMPKNIRLTEDYPLAALATPNFPSNYPEGSECFTFIECPDGYHISIEYIAANIVVFEDYFLIYDSTDISQPVVLRAESNPKFTAAQLDSRSFVAQTTRLHTAFIDSDTTQRSGILVVFRAVLDVVNIVCAGTCDCSGTGVASDCGNPGTAFLPAVPLDNNQCGRTVNLEFTEDDSQIFLATPGFDGTSQYSVDAGCVFTIMSPTNSELVVIFRVLDLGAEDSLILTSGLGFDRIARLYSTESSFTFSDNTTSQTLSIIGAEIHIPANRLTVTFVNPSGTTGTGASFEVRLVDNRCGTRCVNGGTCPSCECASGYYGGQCTDVVLITGCTKTPTSSTVHEGDSIQIRCNSDRAFTQATSIVFGLDVTSTAVDGVDIALLSNNPCVFDIGVRFCTVTIAILDDTIKEVEETLTLIVAEILGGGDPNAADVKPPIELTCTISEDSDPMLVSIGFDQMIYEVNENDGCLAVQIEFTLLFQLTPIPESGTINIAYTPGTATNSSDYMEVAAVPYEQSTNPDASSVEFCIPIEDDFEGEDTETFTITMSVTSKLIEVGTISSATIRILDDDVADNIVIIDYPNIRKTSGCPVTLFAFSVDNLPVCWTKPGRRNPEAFESSLVIEGTSRGITVTFPRTEKLPARRLGLFWVGFNNECFIEVLISPDSACLHTDDSATFTVYPSLDNPSHLDAPLELKLNPITNCRTKFRWKRDKSVISNDRLSHKITQTAIANGVFTVTRKRRDSTGWFEIWQVKVADCPFGRCGPNCDQDCSTNPCQNGGVKENDGTCSCPSCFAGKFCEIKYANGDSFGKSKRFLCSDLGGSVTDRSNCMGLLFCSKGLLGCKCGCGWSGRDCRSECRPGYYGANCEQRCDCANDLCDRFIGCP